MFDPGPGRPCRLAFLLFALFLLSPASGQAEELLLRQKDPSTWEMIRGGARGTLTFDRIGGLFRLRGSGLLPGTGYALVRCADKAPRGHILARGLSDGEGRVEISGRWAEWSGKFWLMLGADVEGEAGDSGPDRLRDWHPRAYLFEEKEL